MFDDSNMGENAKAKLKTCGVGVVIYPLAKIARPEVVELDDHVNIDDFVFIYGGQGVRIGRYVHIASFASVFGGGELVVGDYAAISQGSRLITGTDTHQSGRRMSAALPLEQRDAIVGRIVLGKDAFVGTNCVIHPNVTIGEGAIIGSNSLVLHDVEPWSICAGSPCKKIGERPRVTLPDV